MKSARTLGVIPARGGSKGIPKKNLFPILGKPLIAFSIESAKQSKLLTDLIVSTDSEEIAEVARTFGANVPFLRPAELATDKALSVGVLKHAVQAMEEKNGTPYDYVVLLQPTTPLREAQDIDQAVQKLIDTQCDSVVTMVDVGANHPARMYRIENDHLINVLDEGVAMRPRQELPPIYIRSGDVYACRRDLIFEKSTMMGTDTRPLIIPSSRAVNIDSRLDLYIAEHLLREKGNPGSV